MFLSLFSLVALEYRANERKIKNVNDQKNNKLHCYFLDFSLMFRILAKLQLDRLVDKVNFCYFTIFRKYIVERFFIFKFNKRRPLSMILIWKSIALFNKLLAEHLPVWIKLKNLKYQIIFLFVNIFLILCILRNKELCCSDRS